MCISELSGKNVPVKLWADKSEVESAALDQLLNVAALPWVFKHVAVMPDVHHGKGCTVGSVIAMRDAVSPAAVGVDIGCGMAAVLTNLDADKVQRKVKQIRADVEAAIPVGFEMHECQAIVDDENTVVAAQRLFEQFDTLDPYVNNLRDKAVRQLGTLGGGNHFIELCLDTEDRVWLMLHSGSRNIGKELAEVHISRARKLAHNVELPDKDLAVFLAGTPEMAAYRRDLYWAQQYAFLNREVMIDLYMGVLAAYWPSLRAEQIVRCHHNYVAEELHFGEQVFVTRKGAISAKFGELGIIPGSMGAKSFIVQGLGNSESFTSASHGAGRKLSRGAAKRKYTRKDLEEQTKGIECRKDSDVIDEIPAAYKDIEKVMKNQSDLVTIVAELRQIMCVKG